MPFGPQGPRGPSIVPAPQHLEVLRLHFQLIPVNEIAQRTGYSMTSVYTIIRSTQGREFLAKLRDKTLSTILDVQTMAQAVAPLVMEEKIRLATHGRDERVRNMACMDILEMAGNSRTKHVIVEKVDPISDKYTGMGEDEIRDALAADLSPPKDDTSTVH